MHIAIDDTYGPEINTGSLLVTGDRRTHVAVVFPDESVQDIRTQAKECLDEIYNLTNVAAKEFHFVDIYNRNSPWDKLRDQANLILFEFFAFIYTQYRWPVFIQTIDNRTFHDHGIKGFVGTIDGLDLTKRADVSLLWLLIKIKKRYKNSPVPITLFIDEGRKNPGTPFGSEIFNDWPKPFKGSYSSSSKEPLLQLADFIAFCINRSTHLAMKKTRTYVDTWFLNLVGEMQIDCHDFKSIILPQDFSLTDFDEIHLQDRIVKGL